jgi:hypothetical protein
MSDSAEPQRAGAFGGASVEDLLRALYGYAMTPLPRSWLPDVDPAEMRKRLGSMLPGRVDASGLPQMPEAWRRYAMEQGLFPEQRGSVVPPQVPPRFDPNGRVVGGVAYTPSRLLQMQREYEAALAAQAPQQGAGLWGWLHPQGAGNTARGFNDIYPPLGR